MTFIGYDGKYWSLYGSYAKQGAYEIDPGYEGVASSVDGMKWKRAKDQYILSVYEPDVSDKGRGIGLITSKPLK